MNFATAHHTPMCSNVLAQTESPPAELSGFSYVSNCFGCHRTIGKYIILAFLSACTTCENRWRMKMVGQFGVFSKSSGRKWPMSCSIDAKTHFIWSSDRQLSENYRRSRETDPVNKLEVNKCGANNS